MPRWDKGPLIDAPRLTWRNWFAMLGPGLVMGGAAIGGGEWLMGPVVTARYGGGLMWLATLSILAQVVYNLEISRYALYTGEPIFTGKFRTLPGPRFWLTAYLVMDFGSVFPYLAANAATPLAAVILGEIPEASKHWITLDLVGHQYELTQAALMKGLGFAIFIGSLVPLIFGGKIYNALKAILTFKIVTVFAFLLFVAFCFSSATTWREILSGFVKFGTVPVHGSTDQLDNVFLSLWRGDGLPSVDFATIATLAAFAAIAGNGGLSNAPLSNYTRDQGWGMGYHVGAIPSVFGGQNIALSHVGMVFDVNAESLPRWHRWYRHLMRDQLVLWMPACFIGLALPSIMSVQFLPRGTTADEWAAAGMTADGAASHIGAQWGSSWGTLFWYLTLFSGFMVLAPTMASTIDGIVRRWVDVFWTSSARLRTWEPHHIRNLYFYVLAGYTVFGLTMLAVGKPLTLLKIGTNIMNFALGFSCWHTLVLNHVLLPRELRPNWFMRIALFLAGLFFLVLATIVVTKTSSDAIEEMRKWGWL
ncbi:MAG: Nramp family divalent metal transporter [Planctomycetia bacterium]|nr:Nramp family divalent metal transporter [Planctomycetia bacterium]